MKHVEIKSENGATTAVNGHLKRQVPAAPAVKKPSLAIHEPAQAGLLSVNRHVVLLGAKTGETTTSNTSSTLRLNTRSKVTRVVFRSSALHLTCLFT